MIVKMFRMYICLGFFQGVRRNNLNFYFILVCLCSSASGYTNSHNDYYYCYYLFILFIFCKVKKSPNVSFASLKSVQHDSPRSFPTLTARVDMWNTLATIRHVVVHPTPNPLFPCRFCRRSIHLIPFFGINTNKCHLENKALLFSHTVISHQICK